MADHDPMFIQIYAEISPCCATTEDMTAGGLRMLEAKRQLHEIEHHWWVITSVIVLTIVITSKLLVHKSLLPAKKAI